jgi:hypothetical protein
MLISIQRLEHYNTVRYQYHLLDEIMKRGPENTRTLIDVGTSERLYPAVHTLGRREQNFDKSMLFRIHRRENIRLKKRRMQVI